MLSNNCSHDIVSVYGGDSLQSPLIGTYCGTRIPASITSFGSVLTVNFVSDSTIEQSGFRAIYTKSTSCEFSIIVFLPNRFSFSLDLVRFFHECVCLYFVACGADFTSEHGSFNSPAYPDSYPTNVECVWTIRRSPGNRIQLAFRYIIW